LHNSINYCIFASDDNDTDHRTVDSAAGHDARLGFRVLHAGRDVGAIAEVAVGLCFGRDGGCIGVVEELIPEASNGQHSNLSTIGFAIGFVLMMVLDVAMG
jgi:hypothetical protein